MRRGYTHDPARFFFSRSSTYSSMKCEFTVNWNPPRRIFLFGTFYSTPTTVSSSIVGLYLTVDSYGHFRPFLNFGGRVFGNFACSQTRVAMPKPPSVLNPFDSTPPLPSLFFARVRDHRAAATPPSSRALESRRRRPYPRLPSTLRNKLPALFLLPPNNARACIDKVTEAGGSEN